MSYQTNQQSFMVSIDKFLKDESTGGILLIIAAAFAMLLANLPVVSEFYTGFLNATFAIELGKFRLGKPLFLWINDGLMAIFFLLVGLEVKREFLIGSLSNYKKAIFPALAALGGMIVPALIYVFMTQGHQELAEGWAIPMATDIAFALGVMALLGSRVPNSLKIFLLALAIIDDLGAIIIIALFFSEGLSTPALIGAAVTISILIALNRFKVSAITPYAIVGTALWVFVLKSGVHATLAGVIIGFCIPLKGKDGSEPLNHVEHSLNPWCAFCILPLFAFANAGVSLQGLTPTMLGSALPLGIMMGLLVGKTLGVFGFSYIAVLLRIAQLPADINFKYIFSVALLCGIGFTMSMFLAGLAFDSVDNDFNVLARLGILCGSIISAILGYIGLKLATKPIPVEGK